MNKNKALAAAGALFFEQEMRLEHSSEFLHRALVYNHGLPCMKSVADGM